MATSIRATGPIPRLSDRTNANKETRRSDGVESRIQSLVAKPILSQAPRPQTLNLRPRSFSDEAPLDGRVVSARTDTCANERLQSLNSPTAVITAENPQVTAVVTSETSDTNTVEELQDGLVLIPAKERGAFDENNLEKYIGKGHAQLNFSTSATTGQGFRRAVDLKKNVNGEEVPDEDRQKKVDIQTARIAYLLGINSSQYFRYSNTWHFIEVSGADDVVKRFDLTEKKDIESLLEMGMFAPSKEMVTETHKELLAINKKFNLLIKRELGSKEPVFVQNGSYAGNPNGPPLFQPFSMEAQKLATDNSSKKFEKMMIRLKMVEKEKGVFAQPRTTAEGSKSLNSIENREALKKMILRPLSDFLGSVNEGIKETSSKISTLKDETAEETLNEEQKKNLQDLEAELKKLNNQRKETGDTLRLLGHANNFAMDFATLESFKSRGSSQASHDYIKMLRENNPTTGWMSQERLRSIIGKPPEDGKDKRIFSEQRLSSLIRKHYQPTKTDKRQAVEFGILVDHLKNSGQSDRLEIIETTQRLQREIFGESVGREVFKEPKVEKFFLSVVLNIDADTEITYDHLVGFQDASDDVKKLLKKSIEAYQEKVLKKGHVRTHSEGEDFYKAIKHLEQIRKIPAQAG